MTLVPASSRSDAAAVDSVAAADPSIVVGGTASAVTVATGTLDVIAAQHPPAAAVAMNAKKITGIAAATAATDAASLANTLDTFAAPAGNVAMNAKRLTGLANASAASDAQAFGQGVASLLSAAGDLPYASAANTLARLAKGSNGDFFTLLAGVPAWKTRGVRSTVAAVNPLGTASTASFKMMGLGRQATPSAITPQTPAGVVIFVVQGMVANTVAADGAQLSLQFGTGTAPNNADALAGSALGNTLAYSAIASAESFLLLGVTTAAVAATPLWFDVAVIAVTGGTASISQVSFAAFEL